MIKRLPIAIIGSAFITVCFGSRGATVDSLLNESTIEFRNIAPGKKFQIKKVYDPVSKSVKFKSKDFATAEDFQAMVDEDARFEGKKYGALIGDLRNKFDSANEVDKFKIILTLKVGEGIKHPSKYDATPDELERHSKSFLNIQPVISLNSFFQ